MDGVTLLGQVSLQRRSDFPRAAMHPSISGKCEVDPRFRATFRRNRDSPSLATSVLYPDSGGEHEQQLRILVWGDVVQILSTRRRS
jgi:hypothetical protein